MNRIYSVRRRFVSILKSNRSQYFDHVDTTVNSIAQAVVVHLILLCCHVVARDNAAVVSRAPNCCKLIEIYHQTKS
jgi:hypothetical protein